MSAKSILDKLNLSSDSLLLILIEIRREARRQNLSLDELIDSAENQTAENETALTALLSRLSTP